MYPKLSQLIQYFLRKPERSRRVTRILCAHWLEHADQPPGSRPRMTETRVIGNESFPDFPYYTAPGARNRAHPLSPEDLYSWHRSTLYASRFSFPRALYISSVDSERNTHTTLIITAAEQLNLREHGKLPEKNDDLVQSGYLKTLPQVGVGLGAVSSMGP
jgi:hypothetical protein